MKITQFDIERMKQTRDVKSLIQTLTGSTNESLRVLAADALGDLRDVESAEALAQAALWDDSEDVRSVAHEALEMVVGNQAETVLESYRANPPEDAGSSISEDEEEDDSEGEDEEEEEESAWDEEGLRGLIMVLEGETNLEIKLKAVQALGQVSDTRATQALARATYVDEEPRLQMAARKELENIFGADAEQYIESVRQMDLGGLNEDEEIGNRDEEDEGDEGEEGYEEENEEEDKIKPFAGSGLEYPIPVPTPEPVRPVSSRLAKQEPVVEWDDPRKRILLPLLIGLVVLGIIIAAVFFLR